MEKYVGGSDWWAYYSMAELFKKGRISLCVKFDPKEYPCIAPLGYRVANGKVVPTYPPGYPLVLALFDFLHLKKYVNPLFGALTIFLMFVLLLPLGEIIAICFCILWAVLPIVVYSSTTWMSDIIATFCILLTYLLYIKNRKLLSGVILGASLLVRPTNIAFLLVLLFRQSKLDKKKFLIGFGTVSYTHLTLPTKA